jgi:hypothetical protein
MTKSPVHLDFIIYTDSTIDKTTAMRSDSTLSIIQDDDEDGGDSDAVRSFADFYSSLFRASSSFLIYLTPHQQQHRRMMTVMSDKAMTVTMT